MTMRTLTQLPSEWVIRVTQQHSTPGYLLGSMSAKKISGLCVLRVTVQPLAVKQNSRHGLSTFSRRSPRQNVGMQLQLLSEPSQGTIQRLARKDGPQNDRHHGGEVLGTVMDCRLQCPRRNPHLETRRKKTPPTTCQNTLEPSIKVHGGQPTD